MGEIQPMQNKLTQNDMVQYGFKIEEGPYSTRFTIASFMVVLIHDYNTFRSWPKLEPIETREKLKYLFEKHLGKALDRKADPIHDDLTPLTPEILGQLGFKKSEQFYASYTVFWIKDSEGYEFVIVQYHDDGIFRHRENHGVIMSTIADLKNVYFQERGENLQC